MPLSSPKLNPNKAMKAAFFALTLGLGVVLAVHLAMNGKVGAAIENPRVANAVFWCIGAVTAIIVGLTGWQSGALSALSNVHPLLLTAGALGAMLVFAIAALIPQVGAATLFISLLSGQVVTAMVMSHYGWLGSPVEEINIFKVIGVALMIGGAIIVTFTDEIFRLN